MKKFHFEEHGYTAECDGCTRLGVGMAARPHTEECRKRIYEAMRKTEEGRQWMGRADDNIDDYMERKEKEREAKEGEAVESQEGSSERTEGPVAARGGIASSSDAATPAAARGEEKKDVRPRGDAEEDKRRGKKSRQEEACKMLGDNDTMANFKNLIQPKPKYVQKS